MAVTIADKLEAARAHAVKAQRAIMAARTTTPGALDLLYAVGYLIDAIRDLDRDMSEARQ